MMEDCNIPQKADVLQAIAGEAGTPTYVYCLDTIRERFREFERAFAGADPLIAFAVKANSNLAVIRTLGDLGAGADIVSGGELLRAKAAGVPANRMIFSGVGKTCEELELAAQEGLFQVTLESLEEARELSDIAVVSGKNVPVGLRLSPDVPDAGAHAKISTGCTTTKFGIPIGEAERALSKIAALPGLSLQGVAIHIGSQMMDLSRFSHSLDRLDRLIQTLAQENRQIETVSVGGGLGIAYRPDDDPPSLRNYADLILSFARGWNARLILEPGRWLVADAGQLLTRVIRLKQTAGRRFMILDAGMNDLPRPSLYDAWHDVVPVDVASRRPSAIYDVVGPLCETGDIFAREREMPAVEPGDLVTIRQAGAYCSSMAGNYNSRPLAAEVVIDEGRWRLARRRQTLDDLLALEGGATCD